MAKTQYGARQPTIALRSIALACHLLFASFLFAAPHESKRLDRALRDLQSQGLELIFSTRLVRANMLVEKAPDAGSLAERLDQLLGPHGLTTLKTRSGTLLVVADQGRSNAALFLRGAVYSAHTGAPLNGATVKITAFWPIGDNGVSTDTPYARPPVGVVEATGPAGHFNIEGLTSGVYELEAQRDDHLPEHTSVVVQEVPVGTSSQLLEPTIRIHLVPRAFLSEEIAVRASEASLFGKPGASTLALDREQVAALPRLGDDAFRALSLLPGIASNDLSAQPQIRGGRRDEAQVLLDGQELYGAYHLQDFDNGLSIVAADDLQQMDVLTGNFAADHGDRMGGVIDLRTRSPEQRFGRLGFGIVNLEAAFGGTFANERGRWQATARRGTLDFANRIFGEENPAFWDGLGKLELQISDRQEFRLHGLVASDRLDFTEVIGSGDEAETDALDTRYRTNHFWLTHQAVIGDKTLLVSSVAHSRLTQTREGTEDADEQALALLDRRKLTIDELRQHWSVQIDPSHSLTFGGAFRSYSSEFLYQSNFERELTAVGNEVLPSNPPADFAAKFEGEHAGVFLSDQVRLNQRLTLEPGIRFDRYSKGILPGGNGKSVWSPRFNLAYQLSDRSVLRAGWGVFRQSQRPYEIAVEDGQAGPSELERSEHWVLGYEHQFHNQKVRAFRLETYHRRIDDPRLRFNNAFEPFNFLRELEPDRVGIAPIRARARGVEALLRGTLGARTEWWLNYAYSRSEDYLQSTNGSARWVPRELDQPHAATLTVAFRLPRSWRLSLAMRYHTGWPVSPASLELLSGTEAPEPEEDEQEEGEGEDEQTGLLRLGRLNSERLSNYHRLDARLSKTWKTHRGDLTFFVDIQNVYGRRNPSGLDHSLEDGELIVDPELWPGIFPSLGIRWSF